MSTKRVLLTYYFAAVFAMNFKIRFNFRAGPEISNGIYINFVRLNGFSLLLKSIEC
jgi:hypothetical protein